VWARGLKPIINSPIKLNIGSRPVWARGLKHSFIDFIFKNQNVAPRVGAWIETTNKSIISIFYYSRAPCGRVD